MEYHIVLLLLAAFSMSCDATAGFDSNETSSGLNSKSALLRRLVYNRNYDPDVEPPLGQGENITAGMSLTLFCATPVDEFVSIETWTALAWKDARLSWDPSDFGGVESLRVAPYKIWKPDLRLYNAVDTDIAQVMAVVSSSGTVFWVPPVNYRVRCLHTDNAITNCTLKFGWWTYSSHILNIRKVELDLSNYVDACPSIVQSHQSKRNVKYYDCCPESFTEITVSLKLAPR